MIVACNTASAYAIRPWQSQFPDKKALSVTIPGVERLVKSCHSNIGVLATQATVMSGVYNELFTKLGGQSDAELQLITGHARRETLAVYQHVALDGELEKKYQQTMKEADL